MRHSLRRKKLLAEELEVRHLLSVSPVLNPDAFGADAYYVSFQEPTSDHIFAEESTEGAYRGAIIDQSTGELRRIEHLIPQGQFMLGTQDDLGLFRRTENGVLFRTGDLSGTQYIWVSQGTRESTQQLFASSEDIFLYREDSNSDVLYFRAGDEIWITDGSVEFTRRAAVGDVVWTASDGRYVLTDQLQQDESRALVLTDWNRETEKAITPLPFYGQVGMSHEFDGVLYFSILDFVDGKAQSEFFGVDLESGELKTLIDKDAGYSVFTHVQDAGSQALFHAHGYTDSDYVLVNANAITETSIDRSATGFFVAHNILYHFSKRDGALWKLASDGTTEQIWKPENGRYARFEEVAMLPNGFVVSTRTFLLQSDGTPNGTQQVSSGRSLRLIELPDSVLAFGGRKDVVERFSADNPPSQIARNEFFGTRSGSVLFEAQAGDFAVVVARQGGGDRQNRIYATDGTAPGTFLLGTLDGSSSRPADIQFVGMESGGILSASSGLAVGREVLFWRVDYDAVADVNDDLRLDVADIDALSAAIASDASDSKWDINADGDVNRTDLEVLVQDYVGTRIGDLNLDRRVDFTDFLLLSANFGSLEADWSSGDLTGDGLVGFDDFALLSANFGFPESQ